MEKSSYPIRINKYLALRNIATRREADRLIEAGFVLLNGKPAKLGDIVQHGDKVEIKSEMQNKEYVYYAYHKPLGVVTTMPNPGEKTILDTTEFPEKVFPIGRLDKDSYGLILMTNDGRITDKLLNPKAQHQKEYSVRVNRPITNTFLKFMKEGVRLGPVQTRKALVKKTSESSFDIVLTEGKNRQIRRMCKSLGYEVTDLKRFRIGNIELENLKAGTFRKIEGEELKEFLKQLRLN